MGVVTKHNATAQQSKNSNSKGKPDSKPNKVREEIKNHTPKEIISRGAKDQFLVGGCNSAPARHRYQVVVLSDRQKAPIADLR